MAFFREGRQITLLARRMRKFSVFVPVAASCAAGALISYTGLWLQSLVTATSFMVLGCFNKIGVIAWGIVFLRDTHSPIAILGALVSIGGCYAYSKIK